MIASLLGVSLASVARLAAPETITDDGLQIAQLSLRSRIIIRVETKAPPLEIVEKKGPKCIALADIAGAAIMAQSSVDFILRGGQRVRARFSSGCPALDYYSGFYVVPNPDGQVCVDRDLIRSRAGGECPIDRMRSLEVRARRH